ncbi:hypothetical protein RHSIM_Rhsim08G0218700 [Rhododendron simsii]|uniref:Centromere protein C n=1 Tax=Rhododendron simsii TaxID=118357 RepID=A0A834GPN8_RHOSS|nr:hypothetical protein RHSIM_Rhsim08G0218700 [Rhododendron simsii]
MKDSDEPRGYDPADPLDALSVLSLFPRTIGASKAPSSNRSDDLESINGFMKSMALRSPSKHLEQAKAIVDGNSELLNSEFASLLASEKINEDVMAAKFNENARERRPGLGRRRARFSLKLDSSQPSVNLEPTLDIDHIQDPDEFFLAHEKYDNARLELHLMRGGSLADFDCNTSKPERRRRPGILGKTYKHRISLTLPEIDGKSSQVMSGQEILSPLHYTSEQETANPNVQLQEKDLTGSVYNTENRGDELLDELLSDRCANLDTGGILSFLQERLEIKPLDLDKVCLPDFHDVGMDDFMDFGKTSRKPRKALSDIQNLEKGISGKTPVKHKQAVESPVLSLTSPTPRKSPFASISLLKKRTLQSDLRSDPFSALDLSPARDSASVELVEQSDHHAQRKEFEVSGELKSPIAKMGETIVDDVGSQDMITGESITPCEKSMNDNSARLPVIDVLSSGSDGEKYTKGSRNVDGRAVEYNDGGINTDTNVRTNGPNEMEEEIVLNTEADILANKHSEMEENVGEMLQEVGSSADFNCGGSSRPDTEFQTDGRHELEKTVIQTNVEDMAQDAQPDSNIGQPATENLDSNQTHQDQSLPSAVEPHAVDVSFDTSDALPEHVKEPSRVPLNEQSPAKRPPRSKRKAVSHRKSLAGCGTSWEAGVRRSKRIKMRPLEYWKGERFLYGRIHESSSSLGLKVIGVKYVSPGKETGGKPSIKVKSFVSDEFKELVDLAALH